MNVNVDENEENIDTLYKDGPSEENLVISNSSTLSLSSTTPNENLSNKEFSIQNRRNET